MDIPAIIEVFPTSPVNQLCVVIVHIPSTSLPFPWSFWSEMRREGSVWMNEIKNQTHSRISHQMKVENVGLELNMLIKD